jgi:hypothetical protein
MSTQRIVEMDGKPLDATKVAVEIDNRLVWEQRYDERGNGGVATGDLNTVDRIITLLEDTLGRCKRRRAAMLADQPS